MKALLLAMLPALTGIPASSLPPSHPFSVRASSAADDLIAALAAEGVPEGAERDTWARRAWTWGVFESALTRDALGDGGVACGYLQVVNPGLWLKDATCTSVRKDGVAGWRVGLRVMKHLIDRCGSVRSGLTSYATGKDCPTWTIGLVVRRMKLARETL